jgi:hypothetical protein
MMAQTLNALLPEKWPFATRHPICLTTLSTIALIPIRYLCHLDLCYEWEGSGFGHRLRRQLLFFYDMDKPLRFTGVWLRYFTVGLMSH